ncbi:ATP-binding protein [Tardiphaga sp. 862_B3_N4_1]|uniref:ATP-binding protein n=1 Tax=Tardiphaga sp. 862_B3_N4_1 TaxID=3240764 RepID=UPI003F2168C6
MINSERLIALVDDLRRNDSELAHVEFKVNNHAPDLIGTLISAISNAARAGDQNCGYVCWGIHNDDHRVIGTAFNPVAEQAKGQPLELWLSKSISPSLHFSFHEIHHPDGRLVMLEIPAASSVPTRFQNIAYTRIGAATPKLADHPAHEASLLAKLRPFVWEQGIAASFATTSNVLDLLDCSAYFALTSQSLPGTDEEVARILAHDKLIAQDVGGRWNILNLGAVLFAKDISKFDTISRKALRIIRYDGTSRTADTQERTGVRGYAYAFEGIVTYVNRQLPQHSSIGKALRTTKAEYPELAIRELIANALVHQDMTISGTGPVIEIFDDRVEITNPGTPLVATDRFIDLPPRSRNESLASLMRRIGVCEEQGSGIDKVIEVIEAAMLPPPEFRADGQNTKVTIFGRRSFSDMSMDERIRGAYQHAVMRFINNEGGMTNASLRIRFGVAERNASQISRLIGQALEAGVIRKSDNWSPRSGHYLPSWA